MAQLAKLLAILLPGIPLAVAFIGPFPDDAAILRGRWLWLIVGAWLVFGAALLSLSRRRPPQPVPAQSAFVGYSAGAALPALFIGIWLFSAPYLHSGVLQLFAASCLLPLVFVVAWEGWLAARVKEASRAELALPALSIGFAVVVLGVASEWLLARDPFGDDLAVNAPDRSYWYIVRKRLPDGSNAANSYGFLGPEPAAPADGKRLLLIGDSIPEAGSPSNFTNIAAKRYRDATGAALEIVNASIAGYSLEQMRNFYTVALGELPHDVLLVSYYLDDINRELRYRKNNYLYTPTWPEWMQDTYYGCWLCRSLLNLRWFTEQNFLLYRSRTYEEAMPAALATLADIESIARQRGVRMALINVPFFRWRGVLADPADYEFADEHRVIEQWCRSRGIPYLDLLPVLGVRDIAELRNSDTDIHFNPEGHRVVGEALTAFIRSAL